MAVRERALAASRPPRLFTAQEVARFCEVDLKTVHHWAERGKIPHFRTEGRHLRFRRNDLVRFLRAHGYPLPEGIVRARPLVAIAPIETELDLAKKLSSRFSTRRLASGLGAFARVLGDQPDAVVVASTDATLAGARSIKALRDEAPWIVVALVAFDEVAGAEAREAGAEVVLPIADVARLGSELARALGLVGS